MGLFNKGEFTLHSGKQTDFLINCNALTNEDLAALALQIKKLVPPFGRVIGIPRGGLRLARALHPLRTPDAEMTLVVDDVLTSGSSMQDMAEVIKGPVQGAVLFARGALPNWVMALFHVNPSLWGPWSHDRD